jgi:hypothetical protein
VPATMLPQRRLTAARISRALRNSGGGPRTTYVEGAGAVQNQGSSDASRAQGDIAIGVTWVGSGRILVLGSKTLRW